MWKGHPDCYMSKLDGVIRTPGDSQVGCFVEVDLKNPLNQKEEKKSFPFCP